MTKTQKEKWIERLFGVVSAIIVSLAIFSFTTKHDEDKELAKKVTELDKNKASIEYVDKKCEDTKDAIKSALDDIKQQQSISNQDIKEILKSMPRK